MHYHLEYPIIRRNLTQRQAAQLFSQLSAEDRLLWLSGEKTPERLFGFAVDVPVRTELIELIFAWELDRMH